MTTAEGVELDIGDVAKRSGLSASALRFYERRGLIASTGRNGLRRTFPPDVLDRLRLIDCARAASFTIAQIAAFLVATPDDEGLRARMSERAAQLEEEIARLTRMRDSLRHASTCTHSRWWSAPSSRFASMTEVAAVEGESASKRHQRRTSVEATAGPSATG